MKSESPQFDQDFQEGMRGGKQSVKTRICNFFLWSLFVIQGCGVMLPFNALANSSDYFLTEFFDSIMTVISFSFLLPNALAVFLMQIVVMKDNMCNFAFTVLLPYTFSTFCFAGMLIFGGWIEISQSVSLPIIIILVGAMGFLQGIVQGRLFISSFLVHSDVGAPQGLMAGFGIIGIVLSVLRIFTKLAAERYGIEKALIASTTMFFEISACLLLIITILFFILALKLRPSSHRQCDQSGSPASEGGTNHATDEDASGEEELHSDYNDTSCTESIIHPRGSTSSISPGVLFIMGKSLHLVWSDCLFVFMIFSVTLGIFPGISTAIPVSTIRSFPDWASWFPIVSTFMFTCFDFVGRLLPKGNIFTLSERNCIRWFGFPGTRIFFTVVLARVAFFYPAFVLCLKNVVPYPDFTSLVLMVLMALSNGYLSTVSFVNAQNKSNDESRVDDVLRGTPFEFESHEQQQQLLDHNYSVMIEKKMKMKEEVTKRIKSAASLFMTGFMLLGIFTGSLTSLVLFAVIDAISNREI